jgi:hypothetical protein
MCKTYNTIGSLKTLKSLLEDNGIHDFKSIKEIIHFQNSYAHTRQQLIAKHETLVEEEIDLLKIQLTDLKNEIETKKQYSFQKLTKEVDELKQELSIISKKVATNLFNKVINIVKQYKCKRTISYKESNLEYEVKFSVRQLFEVYEFKNNRFQFITSNFDEAVKQSAKNILTELDRKKRIIDDLNNYIYGSIGEQKVVKTLETLSDDYFLINDFNISFSRAIYCSQEDSYIKSVQMDHILVGPSGIFLIETKNWSEKSLDNLNLRSPVAQMRRANFAFFYLINNQIKNYRLHLNKHHWGAKKIPIKNLIVLTKTKPKEEFQFVKILTVDELISFVTYFKPIFSYEETKSIAEMILRVNK